MTWKKHLYRVGVQAIGEETLPTEQDRLDSFVTSARQRIEPWLSAVFQAEHLNLLVGSGLTTAVANIAGTTPANMGKVKFGSKYDSAIDAHADSSAKAMRRGSANIEDQFRSALAVLDGLEVIDRANAAGLKTAINDALAHFLRSILATERGIIAGKDEDSRSKARTVLQSFLLSFASRSASRERLHLFTTNYDRLLEYGCDLAGLRTIDRFVGTLNPIFRASRIEVDVHYNPPGIRGEPRFVEGVIRLTKIHGSVDWAFDRSTRTLARIGIPFGARDDHSEVPNSPIDTVMIYPNAAKDVETSQYPYAELFRDFAAAVCRPNAVVVTYGYGFGDDHINRILLDMLTIPSTHVVIISYDADDRLTAFCANTRDAQVSLLIGQHFADLVTLVDHYIPKPALDYITGRMADLLKRRLGAASPSEASSTGNLDSGSGVF